MLFANAFIWSYWHLTGKFKALLMIDLSRLIAKLMIRLIASNTPCNFVRHFKWLLTSLAKVCCTNVLVCYHVLYSLWHRFSYCFQACFMELVVASFNHTFLKHTTRLLAMWAFLCSNDAALTNELARFLVWKNVFDGHVLVNTLFVVNLPATHLTAPDHWLLVTDLFLAYGAYLIGLRSDRLQIFLF